MRRKTYGAEKTDACATCGARATARNGQGLPTCRHHASIEHDLKCLCGEWLDIKDGKWGVFFVCMNCRAMNYNKGLEINNLPLPRLEDL